VLKRTYRYDEASGEVIATVETPQAEEARKLALGDRQEPLLLTEDQPLHTGVYL
jgi:hypothetical protein